MEKSKQVVFSPRRFGKSTAFRLAGQIILLNTRSTYETNDFWKDECCREMVYKPIGDGLVKNKAKENREQRKLLGSLSNRKSGRWL